MIVVNLDVMEIIKDALEITRDARCEIIDQVILPCIAELGIRDRRP